MLTINGPIHNYEPSDGLGIKCYLSIYVFECFHLNYDFWYLQKHFELIFELKRTYVRYILFDDSNAIRASIESTLKHRVFHFFSLLKNWDLIRHTGKLLRVAKSYFYMVENINSNLKWYLSVYRMSMAKMWEIHLSVSRFLRLTKYALLIFFCKTAFECYSIFICQNQRKELSINKEIDIVILFYFRLIFIISFLLTSFSLTFKGWVDYAI